MADPEPRQTPGRFRRIGNWIFRKRKVLGLVSLATLLGVLWLAFPQPNPVLWPPSTRDDRNLIYVCIDGMHSLITFPDYTLGYFQEWHMGAATWYLKKQFTWPARAFALISPVPATIRFGLFPFSYWERKKPGTAKVFKFWLSDHGHRNLESFLHSRRGKLVMQDGAYTYFDCKTRWSPLENCNGFIGGALQAAGLPVRESFSIENNTMEWQLSRCDSFQKEWLKRNPGN